MLSHTQILFMQRLSNPRFHFSSIISSNTLAQIILVLVLVLDICYSVVLVLHVHVVLAVIEDTFV